MKDNELVQEIKRQLKYRSDNLEDATAETMRARLQRKEMADVRLADLFFNFRQEFLSKVRPVLVLGSDSETFTQKASEMMGLKSVNADILYDAIVDKMEKEVLNGQQNANFILEVASRILEDAAIDMGVQSYPQLNYKSSYDRAIKGKAEAKAFLKKVISEQVGYGVSALFIADQTLRSVYSMDSIDQPAYPVLVSALSDSEVQGAIEGFREIGVDTITLSVGTSEFSAQIRSEGLTEEQILLTMKKVRSLITGIPLKTEEPKPIKSKPKKTKKQEEPNV